MGCDYDSSWWETVLCDTALNSECWHNKCDECKDGKKFVPTKAINALTTFKQWQIIEVPNQSKSAANVEEETSQLW